jgi:hypothetical protein
MQQIDKDAVDHNGHNEAANTESSANGLLKPRIYALLVGINDYEGLIVDSGRIGFPPLKGCVDDAIKVKTYLEKLDDFEVHVQLLLNNEATKSELVKAMSQHLTKAGNGDVAFLYFSGHGAREYAGNTWLSEHDGMLESLVCAPTSNNNNNPGNSDYANGGINNSGNNSSRINSVRNDNPLNDIAGNENVPGNIAANYVLGNDIALNESGRFLLADKELRYLINNIQRNHPHIVAIFDCCHSGENTRAVGINPSTSQLPIEKKISYVFPQRRWNEFIFSNEISENDILAKGEQVTLPEGLHIQISACESNQSAVEVAGEGVFTKAFLSVLNSAKGNLTYYAVRTRIRQYLRTVYEQTPKIYVAGGKESNLYNNFLNRKTTGTRKFGEVVYNQVSGWLLNLGTVHGMNKKIKDIELLDVDSKEKVCMAKVTFIKTDYSIVTPEIEIDKKRIYLAYIEGLLSKNFRLYLDNLDVLRTANQDIPNFNIVQIIQDLGSEIVIWETDENNADYTLRLWKRFFYITKPNDRYRPLSIQVSIDEEDAAQLLFNQQPYSIHEQTSIHNQHSIHNQENIILPNQTGQIIINQLCHIGKWEFIKSISNDETGTELSPEALKVQIHQLQHGNYHQIEIDNSEITLNYDLTDNNWQTAIRITITNTLKVPMYCCMPYLSVWFGSNLDLLNPIVYKLEPDVPLSISLDGVALVKKLPDPVRSYNWPEETEYLKFIFSTDEFDGSSLSLDEMPPPFTTNLPGNNRGIGTVSNSNNKMNRGWTTNTITLKYPNPFYNKVNGEELAELLHNPQTADFALKIYFDNNEPADKNSSIYNLKPAIELVKGEYWKIGISESELISIANSWANKNQNERTLPCKNK